MTPGEPRPYDSGASYLLDELRYLDLMLRRAVIIARAHRPATDEDAFRGLLITEAELDHLMETQTIEGDAAKVEAQIAEFDDAIVDYRVKIRARTEQSFATGVYLPLARVAMLFALSEAELDLLLVAIAPELATRYETVYAYLQNDVTRKRPSIELALGLICRGAQEKLAARRLLAPGGRLATAGLIVFGEETYDRQPTELRRFIKLDDGVLRFLLGQPPPESSGVRVMLPALTQPELSTSAATGSVLDALARALERAGTDGSVVHLEGGADAPLEAAAIALGCALDRPMFITSMDHLGAVPGAASALVRDARLWHALIVLRSTPAIEGESEGSSTDTPVKNLWEALRDARLGVVVLGRPEDLRILPQDLRLWRVKVSGPDYDERRTLWRAVTSDEISEANVERLADQFSFGPERIRQAAALAHTQAALSGRADTAPGMNDLLQAARSLATPNLQRFGVLVTPHYGWNDLVLPDDRKQQLRSLVARVTNRTLVQRDWGFGEKLSRGRGVAVMFSGPPGTGKTMAAEVVAGELCLDLFQIDLSTVVSKYIGVAEKQLASIFAEAEQGQCVLFFDECDAVFGKRTEVKDAHDHYANMQVNYLLQRLEQYEGVVLLATNFQKNVDEAFLRRLQDHIEFPLPDEVARERIWRGQFPPQAKVAPELDFANLAAQFRLAGGNISNAAQYAAYRAAEEGGRDATIGMDHVLEGVRREFQKQGKLSNPTIAPPATVRNLRP